MKKFILGTLLFSLCYTTNSFAHSEKEEKLIAEQIKAAMAIETNTLKERWDLNYLKCPEANPGACEFNISLDKDIIIWTCLSEIKPDGYESDSLGRTFSKVSIKNCVSDKGSIRMHSFFRIVTDNLPL